MGAVIEVNGENIRLEEMDKEAQKILDLLKANKKSYAFNIAVLDYTKQKLKKEVDSIIFR